MIARRHSYKITADLPVELRNSATVPMVDTNGNDHQTQYVPYENGPMNGSVMGSVRPRQCFVHQCRGLLRLLQVLGFYSTTLPHTSTDGAKCQILPRPSIRTLLLRLYVITLIGINGYFVKINIDVFIALRDELLFLHSYTITSIVTGLLPLQNLINMFIFLVSYKTHRRLVMDLDNYCSSKSQKMGISRKFYISNAIVFLCPCLIRLAEVFYDPAKLDGFFGKLALLVVPLLRVWQMVPVIYFILICGSLKRWFIQLRKNIMRDHELMFHNLSQYFDEFNRLCILSNKIANFFNPFIFISLINSVVCLCLSIYFIIQSRDYFQIIHEAKSRTAKISGTFDLFWGILSVLVDLVYVIAICKTGWSTNEEARRVAGAVLATRPQGEEERFQILKFNQKVTAQLYWGISVWRSFLIERSLLFTLISTIMAYALILVRMKDIPPLCYNATVSINAAEI